MTVRRTFVEALDNPTDSSGGSEQFTFPGEKGGPLGGGREGIH